MATAMLATIAADPNAQHNRTIRTASIVLQGDVATVFPLFGPFEEKKWSRGWDPKLVAGGDAASLKDTVFTISHDDLTATWVVTEWDESRHQVTYAVFVPGNRAMTIRIACAAEGTQTRVHVSYMFTALGSNGQAALEDFERQDFARRILHWQYAINHYLKTGTQWEGDSH
jgi:hypothetical protein